MTKQEAIINRRIDQALMKYAAPYLAGQPCRVKFRKPAAKGFNASVHNSLDGIPEVNLTPDMDPERTLKSYLHELGHVRAGHLDKAGKMHDMPPDSNPVYWNNINWQNEAQADAWRDQWLKYGQKHAKAADTETQGILYALVDYYKTKTN